jgi:hypothetical protein
MTRNRKDKNDVRAVQSQEGVRYLVAARRLLEDDGSEEDDYRALGLDDDSGYGPDSYFARAMAKDD